MSTSVTNIRRWAAVCLWVVGFLQVGACALAPAGGERTPSYVLPAAASGALHDYDRRIEVRLGGSDSAFWLLDRADESFRARLALLDEAKTSLDIQYFIWEKDSSSRLLSRRVLYAADRGVRVRLLLDDLTLLNQEAEFAAIAEHPNIEIRVFNPFSNRTAIGRFIDFVFHAGRLNHRMHSKAVVADGRFALIGGRNIGDRYFGIYDRFVQNDLDIMAAGPVVTEVSRSFDLYWNSSEAYLLPTIAPRRSAKSNLPEITGFIESYYRDRSTRLQAFALDPADWTAYFDNLTRTFAAGVGEYEYDLPEVRVAEPEQFYTQFKQFVGRTEREILISSPYFIPDETFFEQLKALAARGVRVVVLTNSLASNNHKIAHAGYKRWRKRILRAGIELYEARSDSAAIGVYTTPPTEPGFLGLHAKAVVIDDRLSFVGAANIDPRAMNLNTENGFFVESPELAERVTALIERDTAPSTSWRVTFDENGKLQWTSDKGTVKREPALGFGQRVAEFFVGLLPFKKQA